MRFTWIPHGSFLMGSLAKEQGRADDETRHRVALTRGFWLGVHQVTQRQWRAVRDGYSSNFQGDNLPMENVSWLDAAAFCKALAERDGKVYRLPTEAEWEYACRAGTTTPFSFGGVLGANMANYDGRQGLVDDAGALRRTTTPVGSFPGNPWGLYDMHGNVWEWCADWYTPYTRRSSEDPTGPAEGQYRVLRGGSWATWAAECRSAHRYWDVPTLRHPTIGLRVCLVMD